MDSAGPGVYLSWPTTFSPIPDSLPHTVPPPLTENNFRAPFGINKDLYNFALRPEIPIVFAALYIATVFSFNAYNRSRDNQPWQISQQKWFAYFIVVHNVLLALYSFATFVAMFRAITQTLPSWNEAEYWSAKTADGLCKMNGPRGFGDAATFNTTLNIWEVKNTLIHVGMDGNPDPTDVGRLWNEGLAFWGWLFYVSKFYEVIDTAIILAKGKRSATLQTYHHAGAMLCMWAGIRYMSPPIWMFVFINSAIHAMMYTYFALSALGVQVPQSLKRILTSLQIAQFVFGASYAAAHLFVQYDIPIQMPFEVTHVVERVASSASSAANSATSAAVSAASEVSSFAESPFIPATMGAYIKKMLLRAAGEEGVAERVAMQGRQEHLGAISEMPKIEQKIERFIERRFETRYRTEWTRINCIDTSGEAFAIYLNLLYLAPLTFLFARFFVRAYTQRGKPGSASQAARSVADSAKDAKKETEESIEKTGEKAEDESEKLREELKKDVEDYKNGVRNRRISERVSEAVQGYEEKLKGAAEKAKEMVKGDSSSSRRSSPSKKQEGESAVEEQPVTDGGEGSESKPSNGDAEDEQDSTTGETEATGQESGEPERSESASEPPTKSEETPTEDSKDSEPEQRSTEEAETDDTDAMGKSGAMVDKPSGEAGDEDQGNGQDEDEQKDSETAEKPSSQSGTEGT